MKKVIITLLIATLCTFTLIMMSACGESSTNESETEEATTQSSEAPEMTYDEAVQVIMDDIEANGTTDSDGERSLFFPLNSLSSYEEDLYIYKRDSGFKIELVRSDNVNPKFDITIVEERDCLTFDKGNEFDKPFKYSYTIDGVHKATITAEGTLHTENFDPERLVTIDEFEDPDNIEENYNCIGKDGLEKQIGGNYSKTLSYFASYLNAYHPDLTLEDFGVTKFEADPDYVLQEQVSEE